MSGAARSNATKLRAWAWSANSARQAALTMVWTMAAPSAPASASTASTCSGSWMCGLTTMGTLTSRNWASTVRTSNSPDAPVPPETT
ncbi:MAG: hypothetical protein R2851_06720 [Caldilineaceae bacterium]